MLLRALQKTFFAVFFYGTTFVFATSRGTSRDHRLVPPGSVWLSASVIISRFHLHKFVFTRGSMGIAEKKKATNLPSETHAFIQGRLHPKAGRSNAYNTRATLYSLAEKNAEVAEKKRSIP